MSDGTRPIVMLETTKGDITIELFAEEAPQSVRSFLAYVESGFYEKTIFHRVIPDFVVQGGGLLFNLKAKPTGRGVPNEAKNGLKNLRGTVALARTSEIDSANAQFFINVADNEDLDHHGDAPDQYGYAVFGQVIEGMDVVDAIAAVRTTTKGEFADVPADAITLKAAARMD